MSRESDSSSSTPQGRGGATAYPSGTPPYGTASGPGTDGAAAAAGPDEPKLTETTLTTRIRINIPGSRPIPPVVMRTPVAGGDTDEGQAAAPAAPAASAAKAAPAAPAAPEAPAAAEPVAEKAADKTSDWFAPSPRKASGGGTPAAAPAPAPRPAPRTPGAPAAAQGNKPPLPKRGAPGSSAPWRGGPPAGMSSGSLWEKGAPGRSVGSGDAPYVGGPGDGPAGGPAGAGMGMGAAPMAGDPSATGATPWQEPAGQADDWPVQGMGANGAMGAAPMAGDPSTTGATPWQQPGGQVDDWPGGSSTTSSMPVPGDPSTTGATPWQQPGGQADDWPGGSSTTSSMPVPGDPSTTGATPWQQATGQVDDWPGGSSTTGTMPVPGDPSTTGATPWPADPSTTGSTPAPAAGNGKGSWERVGPAAGAAGAASGAGATQQFPAATPGEGAPLTPQAPPSKKKGGPKGGPKGGGTVPAPSSETLVSGVPAAVPPAAGQGPKPPIDSGAPRIAVPKPKTQVPPPPAAPKSEDKKAAPAAKKSAPKKKGGGRSRLVLLGGGIVGLVGVAYAAGLLMDHADVPNGTTVLGVDIGGTSKEAAVQKLDSALGSRANAPLQVTVGGKTAQLKPSVAGLSIDTQATVRSVSGRDYNPLTVIGSLFGGSRKAEPTVVADEEKIGSALKALSGETGAAGDGTIKFEPGKAVAVYGKAHEGLDVDKSVQVISDAYKARVAGGPDKPVALPSSGQQPKVSNAEVDRMMKDFAEPAMSGLVTVQTDPVHKIQFGPDRSLPKILSVKEVNGKLVESYDLEALKELYGNAFNGVLIQRGDGTKKPVTPQDVAGALGKALRGRTPAERIATIAVNGS
ncbi:hypothetical protein GCM10010359_15760 [Streptomyces morookaense]|nr:hypothetical protein [Streptomyces morookaense]GHF15258.1 hypothetical protein GCM10010359_15760 [Streptomyces morookaense]